jgi:hypothetical protein
MMASLGIHERNFAFNSDQPYMAAACGAYSAGCAGSTARWPSRLFADDRPRMEQHMTGWPADIRDHTLRLAWGDAPRRPQYDGTTGHAACRDEPHHDCL